MPETQTRRLCYEMLREEWRLHSRLFSGCRFGAFPVLVAVLVAGSSSLLVATGTALETVFAGLFALAFVFGLHTGSIGLVGRDALQNLLGETTLLVFSARTLPLSQRRLLAIFVGKDIAFYVVWFVLPMALGVVPALLWLEGATAAVEITGTTASLWVTLSATFVLGIGSTIAGIGLAGRGLSGLAVVGGFAITLLAAWIAGLPPLATTPYGVFLEPSLARVVATLALIAGVYLVGALTFDLSSGRSTRTLEAALRRWNARLEDPVATKTLLEVHRSSGGLGKVLFSAAILFAVTTALVDLAGQITGVSPAVGLSFGAILGLSGFTTYNWLTQFDDVDAYRSHPIAIADIVRAKFRAFLVLGPLVGLIFYALALGWHGGRPLEALVGGLVLVGVACYIFGVTVLLTGLSPDEFLFDTVLFAVFGLAMVVPLVPILVVGFALAPVSTPLLVAVGSGGVGLGAVGVGLYRRSRPRWSKRYRNC